MKLIKGLLVLNKDEWFSFRKFLMMNFRENSDAFVLFTQLQKAKQKLDDPDVLEKIKQKHFLGLTQKSFSNLQSKIYQEFENWLVYYDIENDTIKRELQLVKSLNNRGLFKYATQTAEKIEEKLIAQDKFSLEKNADLYILYHLLYYSDNPIKYRRPQLLGELIHAFFDTIHEKALTYYSESYNWSQMKKLDFTEESKLLEVLTTNLPDKATSEILTVLKKLIHEKDYNSFLHLYDHIMCNNFVHGSQLTTLVHLYMIHSSSILWNNGSLTEKKYIINLLDKAFEYGSVMTNGRMPLVRFLNYIMFYHNKISRENIDSFINKWIHVVDTQDLDSTMKVAKALVALYFEDYKEIINLLKENLSIYPDLKIRIQMLLMIAYAEDLNTYYETLDNALKNFFRQLKRFKNRISPRYFQSVYNTAKIIEIVKEFKYNQEKIDLEKYNTILFRIWVDKKIEEGY